MSEQPALRSSSASAARGAVQPSSSFATGQQQVLTVQAAVAAQSVLQHLGLDN
jgi:hypothetical protein